MHKLLLRSASGIIYVALIVGAIFGGAPWFSALMSLFAILAVIEFENILDHGKPEGWSAWTARVFDVLAAVALVNLSSLFILPTWVVIIMLCVIGLYTLVRFTLALYDKGQTAFTSAAWSVMALVYIAMPLSLLSFTYTDRPAARLLVLAMFIMIWLNDTGAFCVGSTFGKRRLFERLSPKKSWEGFFGGLVFCLAAGVGCHYILPEINFGLLGWLGYGAMVCVLSTWGDLFESLMKRSNHIKDSGKLIPGHGGILDRIDSLLFVAVGSFIFYNFYY